MIAAGVNAKALCSYMGHSSITTTLATGTSCQVTKPKPPTCSAHTSNRPQKRAHEQRPHLGENDHANGCSDDAAFRLISLVRPSRTGRLLLGGDRVSVLAGSRATTSACRIRPMPTQRFAVSRGLPPLWAAARARKWANPQVRREPRTARPGQRTDSARPKHTLASSASACAPSTTTIRSISVTADWAEIVCSSSGRPPRGRRAALALYGVPAPAARVRPAFRQRPRDGGDVPIRAGARVPGRSTPSRS